MQVGKTYCLAHNYDKEKQMTVRESKFYRLYFYNIPTGDAKRYTFASIAGDGKYSTANYTIIVITAIRMSHVQTKKEEAKKKSR